MINNEDIEKSKKNKLQQQNKPIEGVIEKKKTSKKNNKEIFSGIILPTEKNIIFEDSFDDILYNINRYVLLVNKLDLYGNSIPLGAFCFGISFIMIGLFDCKIHENPDKFFYIFLLLFGGCGQIIAGLLEYIKGRTFSSNFYLIYGIYFISKYIMDNAINNINCFFFISEK